MIRWEALIDSLTEGDIVPVIGNDLSLVIGENNKPIPLYEYIAEQITEGYESSFNNHSIHELTLKPHAAKIPHIRKKIKSVYNGIKDEQRFYTKPLEYLAKITDFKFYISTAIDYLLEETIQNERKCADGELEIINYSLQQKSQNPPEEKPEKQVKPVTPKITVFKLMGSLEDLEDPKHSAIDEERMLEYLFSISSRENYNHPQAKHFIDKVYGKTFLFIGCDFPDWLMRFFIRISTNRELNDDIESIDYVINKSSKEHCKLKNFLAHCGKEFIAINDSDTENAIAFVEQLYQKWSERKTEKKNIQYEGIVFLSYHRDYKRDTKNLKTKLETEGIQVWFDERDLPDGVHEKNIQKTIATDCKVFVPLISKHILEDPEHYARRVEWSMAEHTYMAKKYGNQQFDIIPCIIDDTDPRDKQIPEFIRSFKIFMLETEEERIIETIKNKLKPIKVE